MTISSDDQTDTTLSTDEVADDITEDQPQEANNLIKKKDIYDHVTVATGLRKREVREAVDATFAYLFDCLSAGKDVQCPPMGKIRAINKGEGDVVKMIYKLNLQKPKRLDETDTTDEAASDDSEA